METDDFFIVPHPLALDAPDQVDVYEYRIAAVQEVPEGDVANAAFVRWYRVGDVLEVPKGAKFVPLTIMFHDKDADGGGLDFEDLPDTWTCPSCGATKQMFRAVTTDGLSGRKVWVHEHEHEHEKE